MNLVDSSGWLEYFADGPNAERFAPAVEDVGGAIVSVISIYEVFKRVCQQTNEGDALEAIALMSQPKVIELTAERALAAAQLSLQLQLPMADAIILATARYHEATLWTQDRHFEGIDGVRYFAKVPSGSATKK